jgi:uncharacterized membrane protein YfcA
MSLPQTALFLLCVAVATSAQALTGFAFALVLLGIGSVLQLAPLADLANVATTLSLASAFIAARETRKQVDFAILRQSIAGYLPGVILGVLLLAWLSANVILVLRLLLGMTIIACAVSVLMKAAALSSRSPPASFSFFGVLSGLLSGMFAAAGPPLVFQFYRQPLAVDVLRATLIATLAVGGIMRIGVVVAAGEFSRNALELCLIAAPFVLGISWLLNRYPPGWSRGAVLRLVAGLLVVTGVSLVVPAVSGLLGAS